MKKNLIDKKNSSLTKEYNYLIFFILLSMLFLITTIIFSRLFMNESKKKQIQSKRYLIKNLILHNKIDIFLLFQRSQKMKEHV